MNIGILGLGTVGGGVVNVLNKNKATIFAHTNEEINIIHVAVKNLSEARICPNDGLNITEDAFAVVNNPAVDVVLELIGGTRIAKDLIKQAIKNNKHVITANKALIANFGNELLSLAKSHNVYLLFEAAVAGGVPILKSLEQGLSANEIEWIAGIINGTGNFILSEMNDKNANFSDALKQAQDLGYAEADPTFDVEGIDAAHKLAILSSMAFGCELQFEQITTEGIGKIASEDVAFAAELGFVIKHLAVAKYADGKIESHVQPTLIPKTRLLANVDGVMNAVLIKGNAVGTTLYYGAGAGAETTASAVIANLVDIIKGTISDDILGWKSLKPMPICDTDNVCSIFYLRLLVADKPGVLANITATLAEYDISVEQVMQKQVDAQNNSPIVIVTNKVKTVTLNKAITQIQTHNFSQEKIKIIPIETLD